MRYLKFWQSTLIALFLLVAGLALAWLMLLKVIPTTFFLSFLSYAASFVGLMLGLVGATWYVYEKRKKP